MTTLALLAALALLASMSLGLVQVLRGPGAADRMMGVQLLGTSGIGVLLLLAVAIDQPALIDVALIFALLAAVAAAALTRRRLREPAE
ncbi:multiple resistance and pH regulation protein F [Marichromatium purpuratum 984]|uniref:Multiple resistance and pH regulation protein F n=1 Tax=Marichromatium purpuratum 984 TaxID=765910 RepID=W0E767_MARPU|nr:monovalent cation/H+ antiporter complex subunit F [Marichromatium purpuratum]AHF05064.1 multiple resistance and pH regulation protein F [Marichromatium purpuratum 984]